MNYDFSLDKVIAEFNFPKYEDGTPRPSLPWYIRDAVEGVQIFGGIGSGKTSGSGRFIALKYLFKGFGGLVLTAKPDEKDLWLEYAKLANREKDVIVIEPGGKYVFNFLEYESSQKLEHSSITENLLQVLKTVIKASEEMDSGHSDDPFWEKSLDLLMLNIIDLCLLGHGKVTIPLMYEIVSKLPKKEDELVTDKQHGIFATTLDLAKANIDRQKEEWKQRQPLENILLLKTEEEKEQQMYDDISDVRTFAYLEHYFLHSYKNLSEKTRSIIDLSFSSFLFGLLKEPVFSLFCRNTSNVVPEDCLNGKIIILNLPVKKYHKIGRDCQILFKYIWQRAMESRNVNDNPRPVFLFADEAQNFIHEHDADTQATARSSRIATVYLTQNLPNYYANMGGGKSDYRVKSFLGTLATKIFHANADIETNEYASDLFGEREIIDVSKSINTGENIGFGSTQSVKLIKLIRPEMFIPLLTGGKLKNTRVSAYLFKQGLELDEAADGYLVKFSQNYNPI